MSKKEISSFVDCFHLSTDILSIATGTNVVANIQTANILVLMWNIFCITQNKLDDLVYIDDNRNIVTLPKEMAENEIKKLFSEEIKKSKKKPEGQKSENSTNETAENEENNGDESLVEENVKEKEEPSTETTSE